MLTSLPLTETAYMKTGGKIGLNCKRSKKNWHIITFLMTQGRTVVFYLNFAQTLRMTLAAVADGYGLLSNKRYDKIQSHALWVKYTRMLFLYILKEPKKCSFRLSESRQGYFCRVFRLDMNYPHKPYSWGVKAMTVVAQRRRTKVINWIDFWR